MIAWCCSMRCDRADCSTAGLVLAGARAASVGAARSAGVPSGVAHLLTFGHVVAGFGGRGVGSVEAVVGDGLGGGVCGGSLLAGGVGHGRVRMLVVIRLRLLILRCDEIV